MDIGSLLKGSPDLLQSILQTGLPEDKVGGLSDAVGNQLSGGDGLDLGDLLGALDKDSFLAKIDVNSIAEQIGVSPAIVDSVMQILAPKIEAFLPDGLGSVGSALGKLFD